MNINPPNSAANQHIHSGKGHDKVHSGKGHDKVQNGAEQSQVDKTQSNDDKVTVSFDRNQKLVIGAKMLMASLNQELTIDKSFSYESFSSTSISIKNGQALDEIEVKPFEFDFEEVAKNVMDFVSGIITGAKEGGASDEKLNELLSQARSGIDQGFSQAREELKGFDIYTKDIEEGINKSYDAIQNSLTELENQLFPQASEQLVQGVNNQQIDLLEQEQASVSITTQDGDSININFSNLTSLSQQQQIVDGKLNQQINYNQSSSFSFEVDGDLDQDELKAVTSLVKDISQLADEFFNGDVEKAWQQAQELGFDDQEIAQFSFDFKEVKQVAIVEHYSQGSTDSPIATISPYIKDLNSIAKQADGLFDNDNLKQLMHDVADQQVQRIEGLQASAAQGFNDFNQQLLNALND